MARKIEKEMVSYLDRKLSDNGLAIDAILKKDARTLMRVAAHTCVGIRESGGNNRGPLVELMQETLGGADREPWCMSFIQTMIAYAEVRTGKTSPVFASEHCMTVWHNTPTFQRVVRWPLGGAIAIWRHGSGPSGHTGIVDSCDGQTFYSLEGNTESGLNPHGKIERDGGGVYYTQRSMDPVGNMHLIGHIKPF